jgi:hypothetical protein
LIIDPKSLYNNKNIGSSGFGQSTSGWKSNWIWNEDENSEIKQNQIILNQWTSANYKTVFSVNMKRGKFNMNFIRQLVPKDVEKLGTGSKIRLISRVSTYPI